MIRVTIADSEQTVSFLTNQETLLRLIAGCSANPASLGELLIAADIYQRGLAAAVMAELMEFDKAIRQHEVDFIHTAIKQARSRQELFLPAFQVIDQITEEEAYATEGVELVVIDLANQIIRTSTNLEITHSGEVNIEAENKALLPKVTYTLPEKWKIQPL